MIDRLYAAIQNASSNRAPEVLRTPLVESPGFSALMGCRVLLKLENLQTTGSFKYRGAANKVRLLSEEQRRLGVVAASSGNHGQALALAGRVAGTAVTVYVSASASPTKMDAIRSYGAELVIIEGSGLDAEVAARAAAESSGRCYVSPYNDLDVIAGQGTIGLELVEQTEHLDAVFVAVGGGGLASGIGAALRHASTSTKLVGCWPHNSPAMLRALELGKIHDVPEEDTLSDGTAGGLEDDAITFPLCRELIDQRVAVSEADIKRAMYEMANREHWMIEGAAGVAVAGLMALRDKFAGATVAVVVCGRNISASRFASALMDA
jgi:threonine dehydratase